MKFYPLTILAMLSIGSCYASPSKTPLSIGASIAIQEPIYKGTSAKPVGSPVMSFDNGFVFVQGLGLGVRIMNSAAGHNLALILNYDRPVFDPTDSDDLDMRLLDKRSGSILASIGYQYQSIAGTINASFGGDIENEHQGLYGALSYQVAFSVGLAELTPFFGYRYFTSKYNNHRYGVTEAESFRTGGNIARFDVASGGEAHVGASLLLPLTKDVMISGAVTYLTLDDELKRSPMLERAHSTQYQLGLMYVF